MEYFHGGGGVLAGLDMAFAPGSFHFLTGPPGAGRTTLPKLRYGERRPTAGTVLLDGRDSRALDSDGLARLRRRIGLLPQDCPFLDHLGLRENVALPLAVPNEDVAAEAEL